MGLKRKFYWKNVFNQSCKIFSDDFWPNQTWKKIVYWINLESFAQRAHIKFALKFRETFSRHKRNKYLKVVRELGQVFEYRFSLLRYSETKFFKPCQKLNQSSTGLEKTYIYFLHNFFLIFDHWSKKFLWKKGE